MQDLKIQFSLATQTLEGDRYLKNEFVSLLFLTESD